LNLVDAVIRSSAHADCRVFLVADDGATAGCAGRALADVAGANLAVTGSAIMPRYEAGAATAILERAAASNAQYVIAGVCDPDARALAEHSARLISAPPVVAVGDALRKFARGVRRSR
jgi:UDP-N-acetyl-D-mannosaminuronic acid transferase (WecB/TagA/CpsF family)